MILLGSCWFGLSFNIHYKKSAFRQ